MLEHFFGSKTRVKLLNIFFRTPDRAFYVRELARLSDIQLNAVRREIANLESLDLVKHMPDEQSRAHETGTERSKYYRLNSQSVLLPELRALLMKAQLLEEEELIKHIRERAGTIRLFILTGFFTNDPEVETDLLLVGTIKPMVIAKIIREYEQEGRRTIRYTIMDEREFQERREIGDKFLYSIFESKHITPVDEISLGN